MKKHFLILIALFVMATIVHADGPRIEPGPVQKLGPNNLALLTVLAANARDFAELSVYGNQVVDATVQNRSPEYTSYTITVQQCQLRGCLGGATLFVDQKRDLRPGLYPPYVYKTRLLRLR